jgi:CRISPR/Cas system-associated endonuclease Cas3-HD
MTPAELAKAWGVYKREADGKVSQAGVDALDSIFKSVGEMGEAIEKTVNKEVSRLKRKVNRLSAVNGELRSQLSESRSKSRGFMSSLGYAFGLED